MPAVEINGFKKSFEGVLTLKELLDQIPTPQGFAVAVNLEVIPRSEWNAREIHEGDQIEVVHAVGGG